MHYLRLDIHKKTIGDCVKDASGQECGGRTAACAKTGIMCARNFRS
jgi:hypothetical protein